MRVIDLDGPDGNAFALLGIANRWSKDLQLDADKIRTEMTSGDYENLVKTFKKYFGIVCRLESEQESLQEII